MLRKDLIVGIQTHSSTHSNPYERTIIVKNTNLKLFSIIDGMISRIQLKWVPDS